MNDSSRPEGAPATRRDFLKVTAAAGAALAANLHAASNVHAAGDDAIRVGLVGCGGRGSGALDNVLHSSHNVEVVAVGDVFKFRVDAIRRFASELGESDAVKSRGNKVSLPEDRCHVGLDAFERVINTPGVNYVILATPPGFRPQHLEAAVAAGKNVFAEKPVATDGAGIRKVLSVYEEALKKGLGIGVGTQRRHQYGYLETMKRIHDGAIGDIVGARGYWNQGSIWFRPRNSLQRLGIPNTDLGYQLHNWYHFVWTCGDHIVEQHVHNLDVMNWAIGKHPVRTTGMGGRIQPCSDPNVDGNIFNFFANDLEYPGGVHALSMARQIDHCSNDVSESLVGTRGTCHTDAGAEIYVINGKPVVTRKRARESVNPYVQEHTDLIASIRSGKPYNELQQVAESTLTAIMARMSAYTGKPVTWEQALHSADELVPSKLAWDMSLSTPPVPVPGKTRLT